MRIPYTKKWMEKFERTTHEAHIEKNLVTRIIMWCLDWRERRKTTNLQKWIKEQVDNPSQELIDYARPLKGKDDDTTIINVLRAVNRRLTYRTDKSVWDSPEVWQDAHTTFVRKTGDCEDGSILIYVLSRLCEVPEYKLYITCGEVVDGGHCYNKYIDNNIYEYVIDWCYYYDSSHIYNRRLYSSDKRYVKEWFSFNEISAYNKR